MSGQNGKEIELQLVVHEGVRVQLQEPPTFFTVQRLFLLPTKNRDANENASGSHWSLKYQANVV
eukprot:5082898-Amphidinium_carterae.1